MLREKAEQGTPSLLLMAGKCVGAEDGVLLPLLVLGCGEGTGKRKQITALFYASVGLLFTLSRPFISLSLSLSPLSLFTLGCLSLSIPLSHSFFVCARACACVFVCMHIWINIPKKKIRERKKQK